MKSILSFICILLNIYLASSSFQTALFKEMNKKHLKKNLIVAPLSAYLVLGFAANGADGKALKEMTSVLDNADIEEVNNINKEIAISLKDFSSIEIANAIMYAVETKRIFPITAMLYEIETEELKSVEQVNNWCKKSTHGKIEKILDSLDSKIVILLLNAIYFDGKFKIEFDKTKEDIFYNSNEKLLGTKVELMTIEKEFSYFDDKTVQIIELPYDKDDLSAIIILPYENVNINEYIADLTDDKLPRLIKRMSSQKVYLELPKFKIGFLGYLSEALKNMGMKIPFTSKADFTKYGENFYLSEVVQKIIFFMDKQKIRSSNIKNEINTTKNEAKRPSMIINRPFLFMLRSGKFPINYQILFMAKIDQIPSYN